MKIAKAFFLITLFILVIAFSAQAQSVNLKFAVISDVKVEKVASALEFIKAQDVDFIILAGDFCYDQQDYYPYFVDAGLAPTSQLAPDDQPIYFVMGNHDEAPAGVALAWATEASEKGIVSAAETIVPLRAGGTLGWRMVR